MHIHGKKNHTQNKQLLKQLLLEAQLNILNFTLSCLILIYKSYIYVYTHFFFFYFFC